MANERLRSALLDRGLTAAELACTVGVDRKTVERWIRGRLPYPDSRHLVARRLGVAETYLWPGAMTPEQVASASMSEIVAVYPHRWVVPSEDWERLFGAAEREIDIIVHRGGFVADELGLLDLLRARAEQGVRVRILLGDPGSTNWRPLLAVDRVEIREYPSVLGTSVYRGDAELLVNPHVFGQPASEAPVLHLRQIAGGSLVGTYLASFEQAWSQARAGSGA